MVRSFARIFAGIATIMGSMAAGAVAQTREVTDLVGRPVSVPEHIERIACLAATTCEKVLLLGGGDKVMIAAPSNPFWMNRVGHFPSEAMALTYGRAQAPNIEDLISNKIDVIFFRNDPSRLEKFTESGLAAVVSLAFGGQRGRKVDSVESFLAVVKDEVRLYGEVLGGNAPKAAADWIAYYDAKVKFVQDRIGPIPDDRRPKVYGVVGPASTRTYGQYENSMWYVELAGGRMVTKDMTESGGIDVSMEQILLWDPDVVFIGHSYNSGTSSATGLITDDVRWRKTHAVQEKKVFPFPIGVDFWDSDSEGVLLMEYIAKTLYPDRFVDLDMTSEVKDYYLRFYHYPLKDDEARQILGAVNRND